MGSLIESHRWNPNADVAELVDALVSGTEATELCMWTGGA